MRSVINQFFYSFLFLVTPLTMSVYAQSITPQKLVFSKICAGTFNQFDATFNYSGFPSGTTFEIQLSDNTGSFSNPIGTTTISSTDVTASQKKIRFAVPSTLIGSENYKLRVKSATGFISSPFLNNVSNASFPIYYKPFENSFSINKKENTATICSGGTFLIAVDTTTPNTPTSSPAIFPDLKYKWYKDNTLIAGASSVSLTITSPGIYYTEMDYGSCSDSNFSSNRVTINPASAGTASISSSLGNPFCSSTASTVLSTEKGNAYQWYKDNMALPGATNATLQANQGGNYGVTIQLGGCESKATIDLKTITIKGTLNSSSPITIAQGESKTVTVSADSGNAIFSWYKNDVVLANAILNSLDVTEEGNYKVQLTHPSCPVSDEIPFIVRYSIDPSIKTIPNLISPNNDGVNDTWQLPQQYTSGNDVEVVIVSSNGEEILRTYEYKNSWPESVSSLKNNNSVYYYIITSPNEAVQRGSITIVR
jgi:gliding motility-associated-like protein